MHANSFIFSRIFLFLEFKLSVRVAAACVVVVQRLSKGWVTLICIEPVCFIDQWLSAACL